MLLTLLRGAAAAGAGVSGAHTVRRAARNQPAVPVELDPYWKSRGLIYAVNFAFGPIDLLGRERGSVSINGSAAIGSGSRGQAVVGQNGIYNLTNPNNSLLITSGPVTHVLLVELSSLDSNFGGVFAVADSSNNAAFSLQRNGSTNDLIVFRGNANSAGTSFSSVGQLVDGRPHVLIVDSTDASGTHGIQIDFQRQSNTQGGSFGTQAGPTGVVVRYLGARDNNNSFGADGRIYGHYAFNRVLTQSERNALAQNFWQVFRQRRIEGFSIPGAGGTPGNATGTTLTATLSLTTGAATGAAAAAGATLTATTSLVAGVATGAADAAGVTLTDTLSFLPGAATVGGAGNAAGVTLTATTSLLAGAATGAASAAGTTLTATLSLIAGAASAGVLAPGVTLTATASFTAGAATGAAAAAGRVLTSALSFTPGFATGGGLSSAPGAQITVTASLITGTAQVILDPMTGGSRTAGRVSVYGARPRSENTRRGRYN